MLLLTKAMQSARVFPKQPMVLVGWSKWSDNLRLQPLNSDREPQPLHVLHKCPHPQAAAALQSATSPFLKGLSQERLL